MIALTFRRSRGAAVAVASLDAQSRRLGIRCSTVSVLLLAVLLAFTVGCRNAPISGRRQMVAVPEQEEIRLGEEAWQEILAKETVTQNTHYADVVERVGQRIAAASGRPDYEWEFKVFASDKANAFALPGGKVAIYEGILPVCENEAGLAVVMSHEVSHVLARHGGERMTQQGVAQAGGGILGKALGNKPVEQRQRWMNAYGAASQYGVLLPYSRTHESEADSIGLTLMAKAGYDPSEAPRFWQRFAALSGPKPPEFLSTHPSDSHRASHLQSLLPQALAMYKAAPEQYGMGIAIAVPRAPMATSDGVQLAGHEESASSGGVLPAAYAEVGVAEFLPPIQRVRPMEASAAAAATATPTDSAATPPPFPKSTSQPVDAGGWTPAER